MTKFNVWKLMFFIGTFQYKKFYTLFVDIIIKTLLDDASIRRSSEPPTPYQDK